MNILVFQTNGKQPYSFPALSREVAYMMTHMMSLLFDVLFVWTYQVEVYVLAFGGSLVVVETAKNAVKRQIKTPSTCRVMYAYNTY